MSKADDLQRRTEAFADLSIEFVQGLPDTPVARRIGRQYLDAATSVAANYLAARRGRSHDEFTAKIGLVSEEADESIFWLRRIVKARITSAVATESLLAEAEQLAKIFGASAHTAEPAAKTQARRSSAAMIRCLPDASMVQSMIQLQIEDA
jgi:four helix bundle protein